MHDASSNRSFTGNIGAEGANDQYSSILNVLFNDRNGQYTETIMNGVSDGRLILGSFDIDGSLGHLTPGNHICMKQLEAAAAMIRMAEYFATGVLTGRPLKVVETGMQGLLDTRFGFAGTEAGARLVTRDGLVYEHSINDIEKLKQQFAEIVAGLPGAMIEDHTQSSIIVGLTKVPTEYHALAFHRLNLLVAQANTPDHPIAVVSGNKTGVNVHFNVVPAGIDKGYGIHRIYEAFGLKEGLAITIGDDKADKPMFDYVMARGGIAIGVGDKAPESQMRLNHPSEAVALLNMMAHRLG